MSNMTKQKVTGPSLSDRMLAYENVYKTNAIGRTPTIIRVDGKAFHTYTKSLKDDGAFSTDFATAMLSTAERVMCEMQTCVAAYVQSDEISFFLRDYDNFGTEPWFGGRMEKCISVSASMATAVFNEHMRKLQPDMPLAFFDSRAFQLPKEEVTNYFIYRQSDCVRNSTQKYTNHFFTQKEMHGKNIAAMKEMVSNLGVTPWDDLPTHLKYGTIITKAENAEYRALTLKSVLVRDNRNIIDDIVYIGKGKTNEVD